MLTGSLAENLKTVRDRVERVNFLKRIGNVVNVVGLTVEVQGITASIGEICLIYVPGELNPVRAEVVGFRGRTSLLMPLGHLRGIRPGCRVFTTGKPLTIKVGSHLLGTVLNGLGEPLQGSFQGGAACSEYPVNNNPPNPLKRKRIHEVLATGVKAIDGLLTCGQGQRLGIFAGSGVGKSVLLGMISRYSAAGVNVIALIGERGREVREFIERDLGSEGLKRSVVVAATSDQPALVRLKGAFVASAIAEYFRDQGENVMFLMDSVTRFAIAQREVGLAVGEPPATKGYTPSVFALLPGLLERTGTSEKGSITAFYTVLVEGDDMNDPVADTVRGILDGHIVLSRELAEKNHYPAIDVLGSVSRLMPEIVDKGHLREAGEICKLLATYREAEDLINIGAYAAGTNPKIDAAVKAYDRIIEFLCQSPNEYSPFAGTVESLRKILD